MRPATSDIINKQHVLQGEYAVSDDPGAMMVTILGSCVSTCIYDPVNRMGGMNHFLLPGIDSPAQSNSSIRYGVHLMELLINELLRNGADKAKFQAKVFGGARMLARVSDIGKKNSEFARNFLEFESVPVTAYDIGGTAGRRLHFWPATGRALVSYLPSMPSHPSLAEDAPRRFVANESVELF